MAKNEKIVKMEGFDVRVTLEGGKYSASVLELPGCVTEGKSIEEIRERVRDAIALYLIASAKRITRKKNKAGIKNKTGAKLRN